MLRTQDLRIQGTKVVLPPVFLEEETPISEEAASTVHKARTEICDILAEKDERLLVVVGPCSVHDPQAALDYARLLKKVRDRLATQLCVVMRVYFEKPRTTVGWKGLINDPYLDGSFKINDGLRIARRLLLDLAQLGIRAGTEFLDMIIPQYLAGLVSWGAIGARTTESQVHRELVSGLSCPVGFKNGTSGNVRIAVEAVQAAGHPHTFLGHTKYGQSAIFFTAGNPHCHIILRGGRNTTNYDSASPRRECPTTKKCPMMQVFSEGFYFTTPSASPDESRGVGFAVPERASRPATAVKSVATAAMYPTTTCDRAACEYKSQMPTPMAPAMRTTRKACQVLCCSRLCHRLISSECSLLAMNLRKLSFMIWYIGVL
jgi:3-deoxy-7-phosphoheptulonate synthase